MIRSMLKVQEVSLSFGETEVLHQLSFEVQRGEMVALLGSSGAGKSSIFKLLIGDIKPTKGDVQVVDLSLRELSFSGLQTYRRNIGVVFQEFHLLPSKTVYENIAYALEVCGEEDDIEKKVPELIKLVGLEKRKDHFPYQLSGGEKQRVSIARAMVHDPQILIADEATGNLDPKNSREISEIFKKLNADKKMTIIFSTHDPVLVGQLKPRVIRLEQGKIKFDKENCSVEEAFTGMV